MSMTLWQHLESETTFLPSGRVVVICSVGHEVVVPKTVTVALPSSGVIVCPATAKTVDSQETSGVDFVTAVARSGPYMSGKPDDDALFMQVPILE